MSKILLVIVCYAFTVHPLFAQQEVKDDHSFADPQKAWVKHLDLNIVVNFQKKIISGKATWTIGQNPGAGEIIFDARELHIRKVTLGADEKPATYSLGNEQGYLGKALTVKIKENTSIVNIYYASSPGAAALQWLTPQQTADKKFPFLFTQSEAILARTWIPCQDAPGIRFTYEADVKVPSDLLALMSASNPQIRSDNGRYHFSMNQPIPSYLMALAVGDLQFKALSNNTGVYAEPSMLEKVAWEFTDIPNMLASAEALYGPYQWQRYDVLVLPPSFPFGGMENPRLTFATPTVIAGDRSLVSLVSHELAHSWSGNLVTNATWNDFWLNEGFTVYFERRIDEELYGKDFTDMEWSLGRDDLENELADLGAGSKDARLKLDLSGRDPDDGMTSIAYEKGALFLKCLEIKSGRENFDAFLKSYFDAFAFKSMTTEKFIAYLKGHLIAAHPDAFEGFDLERWVYTATLPDDCAPVVSARFQKVDETIMLFTNGLPAEKLETKAWVAQEWIHFINGLPKKLTTVQLVNLDSTFGFTASGNSEIATAWFQLALQNQYAPAYPAVETFLITVGRRKFLMPLYETMMQTEEGKKMALSIYRKARPNYHSVAIGSVDEVLGWQSNGKNSPY